MIYLENMPRLVHFFSAKSAPDRYQKSQSQICWMHIILSDADDIVRNYEEIWLMIENIQSHDIGVQVYTRHSVGLPFMDLKD